MSLPAILVNTIPRAAQPALGLRDLLGVGIWAGGLGLEILADSRESPLRCTVLLRVADADGI